MADSATVKRALVTGASTGIGRSFAVHLAERGCESMVLVARDKARLESLANELAPHGCRGEVEVADLKNPEDLARIADLIEADESLDLLVNNAGYGVTGKLATRGADEAQGQIDLNISALTRLARSAAIGMGRRGHGGIVNIASGAAFLPSPDLAVYSATKAYVVNLSLALREEVKSRGLRVLVVCPGFTRTEFQERAEYDTSALPDFVWQSADECVAESLTAYDNDDGLIVTGTANRWSMRALHLLPRTWIGALAGRVSSH